MPTRFLSDAELAQLSGFPSDIAAEDLVTYFRLEESDRRWLIGEHRGGVNRLGLGLQLCTLRWLGFVPDDLTSVPAAAVGRLADQLGVDPGVLGDYGGWKDRTRTEHLREVLDQLGWRTAGPGEVKALEDFLVNRALEHDSPSLLVRLACEHLRSERVVRPGVERLQCWVASARERAQVATAARLAPLLNAQRQAELDRLLSVDAALGMSRLAWLRRGATSATGVDLQRNRNARLAGSGRSERVLGAGSRTSLTCLPVRSQPKWQRERGCAVSLSGPSRKWLRVFGSAVRSGIGPGGDVAEVEPTDAVEGRFGGAGEAAVGQDRVLVAVAAGEVGGEAPLVG